MSTSKTFTSGKEKILMKVILLTLRDAVTLKESLGVSVKQRKLGQRMWTSSRSSQIKQTSLYKCYFLTCIIQQSPFNFKDIWQKSNFHVQRQRWTFFFSTTENTWTDAHFHFRRIICKSDRQIILFSFYPNMQRSRSHVSAHSPNNLHQEGREACLLP